MKHHLKRIVFSLAVLLITIAAKSQSSCASAISLSHPINYTATSYTASVFWFSITTVAGESDIVITTTSGSTGKFTRADVYQSDCTTQIGLDTLINSTDTTFDVHLRDTVSRTYLVKLTNTGGTSNLKVSSTPSMVFAGDFGYCSGNSIKMSAVIFNGTGGTYTWTTSNSNSVSGTNTATVTATPTLSPTTYTLAYHDNSGTNLTQTVSITALPASMCNSCELVPNGAMESTQYAHNVWNNLLLPSSNCNNFTSGTYNASLPMSDPKSWKAPTCGTSDYFNKFSATANNTVGVPSNFTSSNTPAHSGVGYAGFYTYWPFDYREYIQAPLKCALAVGVPYNVSFYVSLANHYSVTPSNNIGAYLSSSVITGTNTNTNFTYTPQVNATNPISNAGSWTQVTGTVTGNGEQWITLGNFYNNANSYPSGGSYYFIDDISVTPVTPTITASSCQNGSVTITAYGAPNTTITTWAGPSSYTATGNTITVATPTAAATYTCTLNIAAGCSGCSNIVQTIVVQPQAACSGTQPSSYTITTAGNYTYNPTQGYIASNMQIGSGSNNVNYTFNSAEIRIAAGVQITVKAGSSLTINGSWLHVCNPCNAKLWRGIYVEPSATVTVNNYSIIEDAAKAIYTPVLTSTAIPVWSITNTCFNNDSIDMYIDDYGSFPADLSGNSITNSIFTCRNLGNHTVANSSTFGTMKSDIDAATPLLHSASNPTDLCISGNRTVYGIYLNHSATYSTAVNVGTASNGNLFDNLTTGIYANRTSLTSKANIFQNMTGAVVHGAATGIGIHITGDVLLEGIAFPITLIVGNSNTTVNNNEKCYFTDCLRGIYAERLKREYVNNNVFDCETTASSFGSGLVTGQYGVINTDFAYGSGTTSANWEIMQFANNTSNNYSAAYYHDFQVLYNTSSPGSGYFYNNTIGVSGNNYSTYGIYMQQSVAPGANTGVPQGAIYVNANTIKSCNVSAVYVTGVNTSTATAGFVQIAANTELSVKYNGTYTAQPSPAVAAVGIYSSPYVKVNDNSLIKCTGLNVYPSSNTEWTQGVYVNASPHSIVNCNKTYNVGEGFIWDGSSAGSTWQQNQMNAGRFGLVLRNSGVMGDQGSSSTAIADTWLENISSGLTDYQTLADGSNPGTGGATSLLYCNTSSCGAWTETFPCANSGINLGTAYSSGTTIITTTASPIANLCAGGGGGGRYANDTASINAATDSLRQVLLSMLAPNSHFPVYDYESHWAIQYFVNSVMSSIPAMSGYENAKALALIDGNMASGNYSQAWTDNNALMPTNVIESNWKNVNSIVINLAVDTSYKLDSGAVSTLKNIAAQCPHTGGAIVFRARTILNNYYGDIVEYPNDCPVLEGESQKNAANIQQEVKETNLVTLYPNPNNGQMQVDYKITEDADLQILDINGNLVCTYPLRATANTVRVSDDRLGNGVYFYRVAQGSIIYKCQKLVIIK